MCKILFLIGIVAFMQLSTEAVSISGGNLISYGVCQSQFNSSGLCLHIPDCNYLYNFLLSDEIDSTDKELLQKSQCGYDNTQTDNHRRILVCCPDKYCNDPSIKIKNIPDGNILPTAGTCGSYLNDRIYGGTETNMDEFAWMVLINYKKPNNTFGFHCGGSLITSRYVLTAAHCVRNPKMNETWEIHSVRLGEWDTRTDPDCETDVRGRKTCAPQHIDIQIEEFIMHEGYVPTSLNQFDDIALLRLVRPIEYTDYVKPICLPVASELLNKDFVGVVMDVAGWGATDASTFSEIKMKTTVPVWKWADCTNPYKMFKIKIDKTKQVCAGGQSDKDTCGGDSGGPLMVSELVGDIMVTYIIGVVSYGPTPCALHGWPGVYTHVGSYMDWIINNLKP